MTPVAAGARTELLEAVFSDDPAPNIHTAVVVSHSGDECLGASWLLSRLYDRTSVFRLSPWNGRPDTSNAITLTGLPAERCVDLGLATGTLAHDLESLVWLVSATVKSLEPRMLVTHAPEGVNLDHDAVAFAVQATALMLPRFGGVAPVVLEFQCQHDGPEAGVRHSAARDWKNGVRIDFGAESRRLKQQILADQLGPGHGIDRRAFRAEFYRSQNANELGCVQCRDQQRYHDAPQYSVGEFRSQAAAVLRGLAHSGLVATAVI
jgi:hypothetical protein